MSFASGLKTIFRAKSSAKNEGGQRPDAAALREPEQAPVSEMSPARGSDELAHPSLDWFEVKQVKEAQQAYEDLLKPTTSDDDREALTAALGLLVVGGSNSSLIEAAPPLSQAGFCKAFGDGVSLTSAVSKALASVLRRCLQQSSQHSVDHAKKAVLLQRLESDSFFSSFSLVTHLCRLPFADPPTRSKHIACIASSSFPSLLTLFLSAVLQFVTPEWTAKTGPSSPKPIPETDDIFSVDNLFSDAPTPPDRQASKTSTKAMHCVLDGILPLFRAISGEKEVVDDLVRGSCLDFLFDSILHCCSHDLDTGALHAAVATACGHLLSTACDGAFTHILSLKPTSALTPKLAVLCARQPTRENDLFSSPTPGSAAGRGTGWSDSKSTPTRGNPGCTSDGGRVLDVHTPTQSSSEGEEARTKHDPFPPFVADAVRAAMLVIVAEMEAITDQYASSFSAGTKTPRGRLSFTGSRTSVTGAHTAAVDAKVQAEISLFNNATINTLAQAATLCDERCEADAVLLYSRLVTSLPEYPNPATEPSPAHSPTASDTSSTHEAASASTASNSFFSAVYASGLLGDSKQSKKRDKSSQPSENSSAPKEVTPASSLNVGLNSSFGAGSDSLQGDERLKVRNVAIFSQFATIAEAATSPVVQQRVAEAIMKVMADHPANYMLTNKTQVLAKMLHRLSLLYPTGQLAVVQVLQFMVQQLYCKPKQAIFIAVSKLVDPNLTPRIFAALVKVFSEFIKLDPEYRADLKDAGLPGTIVQCFNAVSVYPFDALSTPISRKSQSSDVPVWDPTQPSNIEGSPSEIPAERARNLEAAAELLILLISGGSPAASENLLAVGTEASVHTIAVCARNRKLGLGVAHIMRKLLRVAACMDARRDGPPGFAEALLQYLSHAAQNVGTDWAAVSEVVHVLLYVVSTEPVSRPFFSRVRTCGGVQVPLSVLRGLSGIGRSPSDPEPPVIAKPLSRQVWALASVMCARHTIDMGSYAGTKALPIIVGPLRAAWDLLLAATGYWLDESTHELLLQNVEIAEANAGDSHIVGATAVAPPELDILTGPSSTAGGQATRSMPQVAKWVADTGLEVTQQERSACENALMRGFILFPAALSNVFALLPELTSDSTKELLLLLGSCTFYPLLIPGDVNSANAVVSVGESEWNEAEPKNNDFFNFLMNPDPHADMADGNVPPEAFRSVHKILPAALAAWHQPSQLKRLAALAYSGTNPVQLLSKISNGLLGASSGHACNRAAFSGVGSFYLAVAHPSLPWPPQHGICISVWFKYDGSQFRAASSADDTQAGKQSSFSGMNTSFSSLNSDADVGGPVLTRISWLEYSKQRFFYHVGIDPSSGHLILACNQPEPIPENTADEPPPQLFSFSDFRFQKDTMYHVVLVHQRPSIMKLSLRSDVTLYVNGDLKQRISVAYPFSQMQQPRLKLSCGYGRPRAARPFMGSWNRSGRLEVAQVRVADFNPGENIVQLIHALGPSYYGSWDQSCLSDFALDHITSSACPVLDSAQARLLSTSTTEWPSMPSTAHLTHDAYWVLLPSSGTDQGTPVSHRSKGAVTTGVYTGNITCMAWLAPNGCLGVIAAQRGALHLVLGWALEGETLGLGCADKIALKDAVLAVLAMLRAVGDVDVLVASDYTVHLAVAQVLEKNTELIDASVIAALFDAAFHNDVARSMPLIRHVILNPKIWLKVEATTAILLFHHLEYMVCQVPNMYFNALRLERGADLTRGLLLCLLGFNRTPPTASVLFSVLSLLKSALLALSGESNLVEHAIRDVVKFIEFLTCSPATSEQLSQASGPSSPRAPEGVSNQSWKNPADIIPPWVDNPVPLAMVDRTTIANALMAVLLEVTSAQNDQFLPHASHLTGYAGGFRGILVKKAKQRPVMHQLGSAMQALTASIANAPTSSNVSIAPLPNVTSPTSAPSASFSAISSRVLASGEVTPRSGPPLVENSSLGDALPTGAGDATGESKADGGAQAKEVREVFLTVLRKATDVRWFARVIAGTKHPVLAALCVRLFGLTVANPSGVEVMAFKKSPVSNALLSDSLAMYSNQSEVYNAMLALLCDVHDDFLCPAELILHLQAQTEIVDRSQKPVGDQDPTRLEVEPASSTDHPLFSVFVSLVLALCQCGYTLGTQRGTGVWFPKALGIKGYFIGLGRKSQTAAGRWRVALFRTRVLQVLRAHFGLQWMRSGEAAQDGGGIIVFQPKPSTGDGSLLSPGDSPSVFVDEARLLADTAMKCVSLCVLSGGDRYAYVVRNDGLLEKITLLAALQLRAALGPAESFAEGSIGQTEQRVPSQTTPHDPCNDSNADDFILLDPPSQSKPSDHDSDDDLSGDSDVSDRSIDIINILPDAPPPVTAACPHSSGRKAGVNWLVEPDEGFETIPSNYLKSPAVSVIISLLTRALYSDAAWQPLACAGKKNKRTAAKRSTPTHVLHKVFSFTPTGTGGLTGSAMIAFQMAMARAAVLAIRDNVQGLANDQLVAANAIDALAYLATRLCAGCPTPVSEILDVGADMLHASESCGIATTRQLWLQVLNPISLWLLSPHLHPAGVSLEYGVNALLSALPTVLNAANTEVSFLQQVAYLSHELLKHATTPPDYNDTLRDKVLVILRLLVDTYRSHACLQDVFTSVKRNLLHQGFALLDGTSQGTIAFCGWAATNERVIDEFFLARHVKQHRKWARQEDKWKVWLGQTTHATRIAMAEREADLASVRKRGREWLSTPRKTALIDASVLVLPASVNALLRHNAVVVISPHMLTGSSSGNRSRNIASQAGTPSCGYEPSLWPVRIATSLGPCVAAGSDYPRSSDKHSQTKEVRRDEHSTYRLSCISTSDDGMYPLSLRVHAPPFKLPCRTDMSIESLSPTTSWLCRAIVQPAQDTVVAVYNVSRVWYLESIPMLAIVGQYSLFFVSHCRRNESGDIEFLPASLTRGQQPPGAAASKSTSQKNSETSAMSGLRSGWKGIRGVMKPGNKKDTDAEEQEHRVLLSMTLVHLFSSSCVLEIPLKSIREVVPMRTHHEPVAVEITTEVGKNFFFTILNASGVMSKIERDRFLRTVNAVAPFAHATDQATLADATLLWRNRLLTTYDYILAVNTAAGRTFTDINQYPVMPWVLADYESGIIDLTKPESYRDLSKPMGALDDKRALSFEKRFSEWDDSETPKFHYGSHYSTPMMVLWYLTRMQPYTSYAVVYQGGRLDLADRLFHSIADAWQSASRGSNTDVKELIPEFYTHPECFVNANNLHLGANRDGHVLGDVVLPPWATDAQHFVTVHRSALESSFVASMINKWLDLIFGFAQSGDEAQARLNVFFHLTYSGGLQALIESSDDDGQKWAASTQVSQFGQTPKQLWASPHPSRFGSSGAGGCLRLSGLCKKAVPSKCSSAVAFSRGSGAAAEFATGSTLSWVYEIPTESSAQVMLLSTGLARLGDAHGYVDASRRDGCLRVYAAGDSALVAQLPLPCGAVGATAVASLFASFVIFLSTAHGVLVCELETEVIPAYSAQPRPVWTSTSHPSFRGVKPLYRLVSHWGPVDRILHIPNTTLLITTGSDSSRPVLWHVGPRQGTYAGHLREHKGPLLDAKVYIPRRWMFTCTSDTVYIFRLSDLTNLAKVKVQDHSAALGSVTAIEPMHLPEYEDKVTFFTGHSTGKVGMWCASVTEAGGIGTISYEQLLTHVPRRLPVVALLQRPLPFVARASGHYYPTLPSDQLTSSEKLPFLFSAHKDGTVLQWCGSGDASPLWQIHHTKAPV
ncbi:BEACH domain-containing protein lvsA [Diplonema papillatum]|nr:BEACH domain-containing protein lvsA [Diplonema papillatum]